MPAFATDVFGAKNAGTIYGAMLTAWSAGAIVGPLLIAAIPYRSALPLMAAMLAIAAFLPLLFDALMIKASCRLGHEGPAPRPSLPPIGSYRFDFAMSVVIPCSRFP